MHNLHKLLITNPNHKLSIHQIKTSLSKKNMICLKTINKLKNISNNLKINTSLPISLNLHNKTIKYILFKSQEPLLFYNITKEINIYYISRIYHTNIHIILI